MAQENTPADRETYVLVLHQQAHERAEETKRKYRQDRGHIVDAAMAKRRRENLVRSKYGKRAAYSLIAATLLVGLAKNHDRFDLDQLDFKAASDYIESTAASLSTAAQDASLSVLQRVTSTHSKEPKPAVIGPDKPVEPNIELTADAVAVLQPTATEVVAEQEPADDLKDLVVDTANIIDVPFARSISELGPKGKSAIAGVAKVLGSPRLIEVIGMADRSEEKALATVRSVSVVDALVRAGIDPTIVKFSGVSL